MAAATSMPLSTNDLQILNTIFDPESSPETPTVRIDTHLPPDPHILDPSLFATLQNRELSAIRLIESYEPKEEPNNPNAADVSSARRETYLQARTILTDIITHHPEYASAYNNRAQLHRWRFGGSGLPSFTFPSNSSSSPQQQQFASVVQTLADLATAIELANPQCQSATVSPHQAKILASAWTQRGAVFLSVARGLKRAGLERLPSVALVASAEEREVECAEEDRAEEWMGWDRMRFEEEGSRCFYVAGLYGSEVGRAMAVMANPYARLCGAIVKEAIRGESWKG